MDVNETRIPDALDPYLRQGPIRQKPAARKKGALREWTESLTFTVVFVLLFTSFVAQATQVPTQSMKPTIMVGDHFFIDKLAFPANYPEIVRPLLPRRALERGDIIAFHPPLEGEIPFVKRIVGLPGEEVAIRDKVVYINGRALDEPYKIHTDEHVYGNESWTLEGLRVRDQYGPVVVPGNSFFAMGDNRDESNDGRYWGFVRHEDIIGKPLFVYWSYEADQYTPGPRSIVDRLEGYVDVARHFFSRTRWFRTGVLIR